MLSGPEALLTFMLDNSFSTPSTVMVKGCIRGNRWPVNRGVTV